MDNVFAKMMRSYPSHHVVYSSRTTAPTLWATRVIVAAWNAVIERNTLREQKQAVSVLRRRGEPIWIVECQCPGLDGYAVCMLLGTLLKLLCTRLGIRVAYGYTQDHYQ